MTDERIREIAERLKIELHKGDYRPLAQVSSWDFSICAALREAVAEERKALRAALRNLRADCRCGNVSEESILAAFDACEKESK